MLQLPDVLPLPLHLDENGVIRVSGTRVTLDSILRGYLRGERAVDLHDSYPTVPLADIHAVLSYYLTNRDSLDAYLQAMDEQAAAVRDFWEARYTPEQRARINHFRELAAAKKKSQ